MSEANTTLGYEICTKWVSLLYRDGDIRRILVVILFLIGEIIFWYLTPDTPLIKTIYVVYFVGMAILGTIIALCYLCLQKWYKAEEMIEEGELKRWDVV